MKRETRKRVDRSPLRIDRSATTISRLLIATVVCLTLICSRQARAQDTKPKVDATAIVLDLEDIDRLRSMAPLKITAEQAGKLAQALDSARTEYDKKVTELGTRVFGPLMQEARDIRKQMLAGGELPREFDDKVAAAQADFLKQRNTINTENIQKVATAVKGILTESQAALATKMERREWEKEHPDAKNATDGQLFNLYCVDVFISNPRAGALLKEIKGSK